jgi:hypothetical protein
MAGSYHELSKETNNNVFFTTVLNFCAKRVTDGAKAFGTFDPKTVVKAQVGGNAAPKSKKKLLIAALYFLIGLVLALIKRSKRLFLIWPAMPFLKK